MEKEEILKIITEEAEKLEKKYREEGEIHEDYYIWGVWRLVKKLEEKFNNTSK